MRPVVLRHRLRRLLQTPRTFANWAPLLAGAGRGLLRRGPAELRFLVRDGTRITTPNAPGARVPVFEVFAEDCYRLDWCAGPPTPADWHVLDIGAHVGAFAVALARRDPAVRITCYEPSALTAAYALRNVRDNRLEGRVQLCPEAVAAGPGWAELAEHGPGSALNGLTASGGAAGPERTRVPTVGFDEAVARVGAPVQLVKIDCEGGEYDLVLGSSPASWAGVQRVVLEHHPVPGRRWSDLRDWFAGQGLHLAHHEPAGPDQGTAWLSRAAVPVAW